jgi:UDP-N-acetylmuramoyl-L-alanyl-D-glutamate--2,6-diaminopimelate ligase
MHLTDLLAYLPHVQTHGPTDIPITNLAYDSRQVQPGSLFVAVRGFHVDGHAYIPQALERGATALVVDARYWSPGDQPATVTEQCTLLVVPDSRVALAPLAAAFYGYPAQQLGVVGITGTKGKSTTTALVSQVLEGGGQRTGMMSTVDFKVGVRQWANTTRQSTPEAPEVQALLRAMVTDGCDYAVLEATSHALSERWNRLGHCAFDVAVFLNVTHEHLDYHGSVEQYRQDKTRLFAMLEDDPCAPTAARHAAKARKFAIVNADDPFHQMFLEAAPASAQRLTYAINAPADIRAYDIVASPEGTRLRVATPWGEGRLDLQLPGGFNVLNALAALSVALTQGVTLEQAAAALSQVRGVRGRMQQIDQGQPFSVIVDYAHNPDSFEQVMGMLRPLTASRIIAVFGSAGERDREKRPLQGAIAARYCDQLILTDEDPRREDRQAIIAEIAAGAERAGKQAGSGYLSIPDRAEAIRTAFAQAQPGDLVLLLGKGHEGSIEYADGKHPWDEAAEARAALREAGYGTANDA